MGPQPFSRSLPQINSLSSGLMLGITLYRNQPGTLNKCLAEIGYGFTAVVASVEAVAAMTFSLAATAIAHVNPPLFERSLDWLQSSSFTVLWAATDVCLNPVTVRLVADEASAQKIAKGENHLMEIPRGAIF